jgi:glucose/mannose-6-phosphate isomerase
MTSPADGDPAVLDDQDELQARDPGEMLRATASAGAQVREALLRLDHDAVAQVVADGRPRALVVAGVGGSGLAGDVVVGVTGPTCPVPVFTSRGHRLPGWVGPMDLVVAVSASGDTEETLAATDEALRRGARLVTVGRPGTALARRSDGGRAVHLAVDTGGRPPRASLWTLTTPLLSLVHGLGLASVPAGLLAGVADQLDELAQRCGPASETYANRAKQTALQLSGTLPHVWGASELATVAAGRMAHQLACNAKVPSVHGPMTDVHHHQVAALAGRYGAGGADSIGNLASDIFHDPLLDGPPRERLRLLLLRDTGELEQVTRAADATVHLAEQYGVPVDQLRATGEHPLERLASLVAPLDFASVYLALLEGTDPLPIDAVVTLRKASRA